jgi:hypothetical protein
VVTRRRKSFDEVLAAAVNDLTENGFTSAERVQFWIDQLRRAAQDAMKPEYEAEDALRRALSAIYKRLVERGQVARFHPGVGRFTLQRVAPHLRAELDRRILAATQLIKLNRSEAVQKVLQRFSGWSTSIPTSGSATTNKTTTKADISKSLKQLPFVERRLHIDQGHKLTASINNVVAQGGGAIALIWRSNWRQAGYNYREDHKERDGEVYLIRGNWAQQKGLVKPGAAGYYDKVTAVGEEPFCRCYAVYIYTLRGLPEDMLTRAGKEAIGVNVSTLQPISVQVEGRPVKVELSHAAKAAGDRLVRVNVVAFDQAWARDKSFYAGPGGVGESTSPGRYNRFREFIKGRSDIEASEVGVMKNGAVGFTNGRHRFAVLRDMGLTSIPVSMDRESIQHAAEHGYLVTSSDEERKDAA